MIEKAEGGDREALIYLIDRLVGRPKQAIDNRMSFEWEVTPDERMQKLMEVEEQARAMLAPWREVDTQSTTNEQADNAQESGT